ncbi:hypothetical protein B0H67DRAFT_675768 [Lasiosphaeris hirsuta]|uniref:Uncharacterized protein n=1 Tax=Lasiosphaeris hirsuta TaxID=260670 RepID=A0AA40DGI0_9PEZI|nr:hypothetical protein B0H67DRAFT_675768 [Lasiosphaeris hirsuta]
MFQSIAGWGAGASLICDSCLTLATQCLCRRDLIGDFHKYIRKPVSEWCGGKEVDVDAALKICNGDCSSGGFPIPGYTYINTETVRVTIATPTSSKETTSSVPTAKPSAATTNSASGTGGGRPSTTTTVGIATATTTAHHPSSSSRVHPPPWLPLLALAIVIPFILGTARAQTLAVTLTESAPPSTFISVVNTRQSVLSELIVSIRKVAGTESSETLRTESSLGISTVRTADDSRTDAGSTSLAREVVRLPGSAISSVHAEVVKWYEAALVPLGYNKFLTEGPNEEVTGLGDNGKHPDWWLISTTENILEKPKMHHAFVAKDEFLPILCVRKGDSNLS